MKLAQKSQNRCGTLLTEFVVCCVLLAGVSATLVPLANHVFKMNDHSRFENLALAEISNLQQDVLSEKRVDELQLSSWFKQRFPDSELQIAYGDQEDQRYRLTIQRPIPGYETYQNVSITFWQSESQP